MEPGILLSEGWCSNHWTTGQGWPTMHLDVKSVTVVFKIWDLLISISKSVLLCTHEVLLIQWKVNGKNTLFITRASKTGQNEGKQRMVNLPAVSFVHNSGYSYIKILYWVKCSRPIWFGVEDNKECSTLVNLFSESSFFLEVKFSASSCQPGIA